jgi:hypothetical protein
LVEGLADQLENTYPVAGIAVMLMAAPALTVTAAAGVMVPPLRLPGASV